MPRLWPFMCPQGRRARKGGRPVGAVIPLSLPQKILSHDNPQNLRSLNPVLGTFGQPVKKGRPSFYVLTIPVSSYFILLCTSAALFYKILERPDQRPTPSQWKSAIFCAAREESNGGKFASWLQMKSWRENRRGRLESRRKPKGAAKVPGQLIQSVASSPEAGDSSHSTTLLSHTVSGVGCFLRYTFLGFLI